LIHVVDETAKVIHKCEINSIGLLGTKFTMEGEFYINILEKKYRLHVILPEKEQREYINNAIFNEFAQGIFLDSTKAEFLDIIKILERKGAEAIILGCTEIPLLIKQSDVDIGIVADGKNPEAILEKRLIFISELSRILRKDVHPVILNFASNQLIRQIFEKGKCILVNDKKRLALFKMFQFAELAEFAYYKELTQSGFIRKVMEA